MKLNYKRVLLVGMAFFLISAFWQAYDQIVPLILTNHYGLSQFLSGIVMSLDNVLAVFLLPVFGALSDKVASRWGKRTPFIFVGTILAVVSFVSLTFVDNTQFKAVENYVVEEMTYDEAEDFRDTIAEITDSENENIGTIAKNQQDALARLYEATSIEDQYSAADALR